LSRDIILISNRFREYNSNNFNGLVSQENSNIEYRNIVKNIISIIDELPYSLEADKKQFSDNLDISTNNELIKTSSKEGLSSQIILICEATNNRQWATKIYDFLQKKNLSPVIIDYSNIKAEELLRISIKKAIHFILLISEKEDFIDKKAEEHFSLAMKRNEIQTDFIIPIKIGEKKKFDAEEKYKLPIDVKFFLREIRF